MRVLLTSGGTKVPIDRVRHIGNMSSGTFGSAIARELLINRCYVDFIIAEGSKSPFELRLDMSHTSPVAEFMLRLDQKYLEWKQFIYAHDELFRSIEYKTFEDYEKSLDFAIDHVEYDVIILAAAVSDYGVENYVDGKIRSSDAQTIKLTPLPKIISTIKKKQPKTFLVGFKLLVGSDRKELIEAAENSIKTNQCNMVVANDLEDIQKDNHTLHIVKTRYGKPVKIDKSTCEKNGTTLAGFLVKEILKNVK